MIDYFAISLAIILGLPAYWLWLSRKIWIEYLRDY